MRRALTVVAVLVLAGCGSDHEAPDRAAFAERLAVRAVIPADAASCVTDMVFEAYSADELRDLDDEGLSALPLDRWSAYTQAIAACVLDAAP